MRHGIAVLCLVPLLIAGCQSPPTSGPVGAAVEVLPDPDTVGKYAPDPVTVAAGQAVRWDFKDRGNPHTVTAEDASFESELLEDGKSWTHTFRLVGSFKYHCSIHPQMVGTVVVK